MGETRWNIRVPLELEVEIHLPDNRRLRATSVNVSFEGIFIAADLAPLPLNSPVVLRLLSHQTTVRTQATLVRRTERGTGLRFDDFDGDVADAMSRLIEYELECRIPAPSAALP